MSNVFERLIGAHESRAGVALDAGDVGELMALYHASFEEDAAARRDFHLNEYLTDRAFGGAEEGGWWYDTGVFVKSHGTFSTREEAWAARDELDAYLAERREGLHDPSSVLCTGWARAPRRAAPRRELPRAPAALRMRRASRSASVRDKLHPDH